MKFDYIVVGAGLAGSVTAERIANALDEKVLIIEKRNHIGGNCYDNYDENGILIHKYGPHIFRTNNQEVWNYLSQFTEWNIYKHEVLGFIDGKKVPIPFNLNTLHALLPENMAELLENKLINSFGYDVKIPILELKKNEDEDFKFLADFIYNKVFLNYTVKQWNLKPEELDPSVTGNVPVFISKDNRYFQEAYQGTPKNGYHKLFENMLSNNNIKMLLNTDSDEIIKIEDKKIYFMDNEFQGKLIFTGEVDKFFNYEFGELPYRSLRFEFENFYKDYFQETGTINYPNNYRFTRITEFKHLSGQKHYSTTIVREYPEEYKREYDIPYYPIPKKENIEVYKQYLEKANEYENILFLGRLAEYKYYNMDNIISKSLKVFEESIK